MITIVYPRPGSSLRGTKNHSAHSQTIQTGAHSALAKVCAFGRTTSPISWRSYIGASGQPNELVQRLTSHPALTSRSHAGRCKHWLLWRQMRRAGEGNRTLILSMGSWCSITRRLHDRGTPRTSPRADSLGRASPDHRIIDCAFPRSGPHSFDPGIRQTYRHVVPPRLVATWWHERFLCGVA